LSHFLLLAFCILGLNVSVKAEVRGSLGLEARYFTSSTELRASSFFEVDWYSQHDHWNFVAHPFARADLDSSTRNHVDMREFYLQYAGDNVEFKVGLDRVFWGVTESQHLVDVINQTDGLEGIDSEDKLGQPLIQTTLKTDMGVWDLFLLPYFRERRLADAEEPLNIYMELAQQRYYAHINRTLYESGAEEQHLDLALRYSHTLNNLDVGLSYFKGTQRDPQFIEQTLDLPNKRLGMTAFYAQLQQWGWDAQYTQDAWLLKWETVYRRLSQDSVTATTAGLEYTWFGVMAQGADLGALLEYSRNNQPKLAFNWSDHDVFVGARLTLNDEQSSELLVGVVLDERDQQRYLGRLEASRRWSDNVKLSLEAWVFHFEQPEHPLASLDGDDFVQLGLEYFY
jgi:hypothetical protein